METLNASEVKSLAIFGSSGATGRVLVSHALKKGFNVRTLVRKKSSVVFEPGGVAVVEGALSSQENVLATLHGCDAVICVFGPRPPYADIFCEHATSIIVAAMQQSGMQRLLCQTGGMIGEYRENRTLPFQLMADMFKRHSPQVASDRVGQERVVMHSGLAWTIVKPPRLTDGAAKGKWQAGKEVRLGMLSSISRDDLADFLLSETMSPQYVGQAVFVRGN